MCIRDRRRATRCDDTGNGPQPLEHFVVVGQPRVSRGQPMGEVDLHGQEPVSYTHPRAHETVLELVCRLLLEKKKDHKKTKEQRT